MDESSSSTKWRTTRARVEGPDACRIEDLYYAGFEDGGDPIILFAEPPGVCRQGMTPVQAIEAIVSRCRKQGVTVEPGEVIIDDDGNWTFRGWRLSR